MPIWDDLQNSIFVDAQHTIGLELMVNFPRVGGAHREVLVSLSEWHWCKKQKVFPHCNRDLRTTHPGSVLVLVSNQQGLLSVALTAESLGRQQSLSSAAQSARQPARGLPFLCKWRRPPAQGLRTSAAFPYGHNPTSPSPSTRLGHS
jgi:hypothetical protein